MRKNRKNRAAVRLCVILCILAAAWTAMACVAAAAKKTAAPARVKNVRVTASGTSSHKVRWKKVKNATGYQIYCRDYSSGEIRYKKVKTVKGASKVSCVIKNRKQGRAYAYVVRAYRKNKAGVSYGKLSSVAYGFIKRTTNTKPAVEVQTPSSEAVQIPETEAAQTESPQAAPSQEAQTGQPSQAAEAETAATESSGAADIILNPTTIQKYEKIFGDSTLSMRYPGGYYTKQKKAEKNMVWISVRTWDFVSGKEGEKYTRTWTIRVHKNLAPTVQKIFEEIYNDPEQFPIHELGGYDWRGGHSEHNTGTAIDINWTENYMVNIATGAITAGKYWKPGEDPYSIPKDGVVARIFNKYGFSQGDWGDSKDYMHFSYFGT